MPSRGKESLEAAQKSVESMAKAVSFVTIDENAAGQRLDNFLLNQLRGVPKSHVYRIVRAGEVRVNKGRADVAYRLALDDIVRIPPVRIDEKPKSPSIDAASRAFSTGRAGNTRGLPLDILFEDDALLAINKPPGMAVHGGSGISFGVIEGLRALRPDAKFLELVHRIDRETSGILLIAKKRSALTAMHAMLRGDAGHPGNGRMQKHYTTLVKGDWPDQRRHIRIKLTKYVTASGERRVSADEEDGQESHTIVTRVEKLPGATLLDCEIKTGRTHQIRVHLGSLGFPIIGDDKYGDFALNKYVAAVRNGGLKRMFLHAREVAFLHPLTGAATRITAPLPRDLSHFLEHLRKL